MRRKPERARLSQTSTTTRVNVALDSERTPGCGKWWCDEPKWTGGATTTGVSRVAASAARWQIVVTTSVSVTIARCGPCCSIAAVGSTTVARGAIRRICSRVISARRTVPIGGIRYQSSAPRKRRHRSTAIRRGLGLTPPAGRSRRTGSRRRVRAAPVRVARASGNGSHLTPVPDVALEQRRREGVEAQVDRPREVDHRGRAVPGEHVVDGEVAVDDVVRQPQLHIARQHLEVMRRLPRAETDLVQPRRRASAIAPVAHRDHPVGAHERLGHVGADGEELPQRLPLPVDPKPGRAQPEARFGHAGAAERLRYGGNHPQTRLPLTEPTGTAEPAKAPFRLGFFTRLVDDAPPGEVYARALETFELAEELGYDAGWVAQHHAHQEGGLPSPLVFLAAAAARTKRLKLITGIITLPLEDPLRLAEDAAVLDALSGGRLELGFGTGGNRIAFGMFGRDVEKRHDQYDRALAVVREALGGKEVVPGGAPMWPPAPRLTCSLWEATFHVEGAV